MQKKINCFSKYQLIFSFFLINTICYAENYPRDGNLREACRSKVSGLHIALYDKKEKAESYHQLLKKRNSTLLIGLKKAEIKLNTLNQQLIKNTYNLDLIYQRDGSASKVAIIKKTLADNKIILNKTKKKLGEI